MKIEFLREIAAPKELVWQVITDFLLTVSGIRL